MDLYLQRIDVLVKQTFGASAVLAGTIGTHRRPGSIEVRSDGRLVASGPTFQDLLRDAAHRADTTPAQFNQSSTSEPSRYLPPERLR